MKAQPANNSDQNEQPKKAPANKEGPTNQKPEGSPIDMENDQDKKEEIKERI